MMNEVKEKFDLAVAQVLDQIEKDRISAYAASLRLPWKQTGDDIFEGMPDPGGGNIWGHDFGPGYGSINLPYAHFRQRYMTFPWENPDTLWKHANALYYAAFSGNQFGKSVWLATWIAMESFGLHPYQNTTWRQLLEMCNMTVDSIEGTRPFKDIDSTVRPKPPVQWWVIGNELPSESKIRGGEDTALVKTFYEWAPESFIKFYRKDKIMLLGESSLKWFSHDQEARKLKGARVDGIGFDEEPPKSFWNEGKPRIISKRGKLLLAMTSDYGSWTGELRRNKKDPAYFVGEFDNLENPFMDNDYRSKVLGTMSEQELFMRRFGRDISFQGKVFPDFSYDIHVRKPYSVSNNNATAVIIDWHPAKPIIVTFLQVNPNNIWYVFDEAVIQQKVVGDIAQAIRSKLNRMEVILRVKKYIIDKIALMEQVQETGQRAKDIVQMFREHGIYCETGNPSFGPAHTFLCDKLRHKELYFDPSCSMHIDQFESWGAKRYMKGNLEGTLRDQLEVEGNDTCINLVYAYNSGFKYLDAFWEERSETDYQHPRAHAGSRIYGRGK